MAKVEIKMGEIGGGEKYDTCAWKSVSAGAIPSFSTKGEAKAIWLWIYVSSLSRTLIYTNVNPTTNEYDNSNLYCYDTASLGTYSTNTGYTFTVTSNSVTLNKSISSQVASVVGMCYIY